MDPSQSHHLKQYTCYELTPLLKGDFQPLATLRLTFNGNTPCIFQDLKHQIIDNIDATDRMYICRWQTGATEAMRLIIFEFNSSNYYIVQMSKKPSFVNIVNKSLFIVGGAQLFVIKMNEMKIQATYNLGSDTIHAVQPSFSHTIQESAGICVYAWNDRVGYTKRFYSQNRGHEGKWWSSIMSTITLRKAPAQLVNTTLKVIIPNVLGLLILSNLEQICLVNLSTMQPIQNCYIKLTNWSVSKPHRCVVKYHINKNSQGFDDSLLISIGERQKQMIEIFVFHIKYQQEIVKRFAEQYSSSSKLPSITSFTSGDVLDSNQCVLSPFIACSIEGALIDYHLTETGIIFYGNTSTRIPVSAFMSYVDPLNTHPILCLEHNICGSYLSDNEIVNKIEQCKQNYDKNNFYQNENFHDYQIELMNSLLRPNRYSLDFFCSSVGAESINQIKVSMVNPRKLLLDWQKCYRLKSIAIFNGDIIMLRQNSISSLLTITPQQYLAQHRQGEKLVQILQNNEGGEGRNSQLSFELSIPESNYSDRLPKAGFTNPQGLWSELRSTDSECFTYEKQGNLIDDNVQSNGYGTQQQLQALSYYEHYYQNFMSKASKKLGQESKSITHRQADQQSLISNKLLIFSRQLIVNRVKDIIQFYSKILKFLYMKSRLAKCDSLNVDPTKQKLLIQYISGLNNILREPLHQISAHGTDLIEMFITKELVRLFEGMNKDNNDDNVNVTKNVDKQAWKILASFFEGVLNKESATQLNRFIKQLISTIKSGYYYIQHILLDIFNPYFSPNNFQAFDNGTSANLSYILTNLGTEQAYFPLSPTLLTIYSYLPVSHSVRTQLITSFVLNNFMYQGSQAIMNKMLLSVVATKDFKDKVRQIYEEIVDYKKQYSYHMMKIKVEEDQRRRSQRAGSSGKSRNNQYPSQNQQTDNDSYQVQIDDTRGIIQLTKIIQLSELEKHLKQLSDEKLEAVFRVNMEFPLQSGLGMNSNKKRISRRMQNKSESLDILVGWIFKYRAYVSRLKDLLAQIKSKEYKRINKLHSYIQHCIRSLENVREYYSNINKKYKYTSTGLNGEKQEKMEQFNHGNQNSEYLGESEQQFIVRVCCRMIGANNSDDLMLYPLNDYSSPRVAFKILPTLKFLGLMEKILHDPSQRAESLGDFNTFAYYYLNTILSNPVQSLSLFRELTMYFDRKYLNELIVQNGYLREKYQYLSEGSMVEREIKGYFGYQSALQLTGSGMMRENQLRTSRTKQGNRINNYKDYRAKNSVYEILPFRNAFLQAINK